MSQTKVAETFEGKACPKGHTERYVKTSICVTCNRLASKERHRAKMAAKRPKSKAELSFAATVRKVYKRNQTW